MGSLFTVTVRSFWTCLLVSRFTSLACLFLLFFQAFLALTTCSGCYGSETCIHIFDIYIIYVLYQIAVLNLGLTKTEMKLTTRSNDQQRFHVPKQQCCASHVCCGLVPSPRFPQLHPSNQRNFGSAPVIPRGPAAI